MWSNGIFRAGCLINNVGVPGSAERCGACFKNSPYLWISDDISPRPRRHWTLSVLPTKPISNWRHQQTRRRCELTSESLHYNNVFNIRSGQGLKLRALPIRGDLARVLTGPAWISSQLWIRAFVLISIFDNVSWMLPSYISSSSPKMSSRHHATAYSNGYPRPQKETYSISPHRYISPTISPSRKRLIAIPLQIPA